MESISNKLLSIHHSPPPETVMNACVYLLKSIDLATVPKGISLVQIHNVLSKKAYEVGANKTARAALVRMRDIFSLNPQIRSDIAHHAMMIEVSNTLLLKP